jgi:phage I-like protein
MANLALATCDVALPPGRAPEWVHLFPADGHIKGRDGREWELVDPAALVLDFQSGGIDLPVDYEHQNENQAAKLKGPIPAAGWIKELSVAANGLWGRVEWTATAAEMIGRKEYRYLSPTFLFHPKTRQIVKLKGAGLVHTPNLYLTALARQEDAMDPKTPPAKPDSAKPAGDATGLAAFAAMVAKMLGLPPETPQEELMSALKAKLMADPDPAKFVPVAAVQAMLAERNLTLATASEDQARRKVDKALQSGHLSPAMKDWATALCRSDEASFDRFIASSIPQFAHLSTTIVPPGPPGVRRGSDNDELADAICSQLGLQPGSLSS